MVFCYRLRNEGFHGGGSQSKTESKQTREKGEAKGKHAPISKRRTNNNAFLCYGDHQNMYKILLAEDDSGIAQGISKLLTSWNMEVRCISDFRCVTEEFALFAPHLVLMDISLPYYDGFHWCLQIRKVSSVPILFLSSAADNMNMVMAMNMGADDFIAKPFDGHVLVAKIQALLRRSYDFSLSVSILQHRGALLNTENGCFSFEGKNIPLSKNEFRILLILMKNKGSIVSREKLMEALWQTNSFIDDNTLTVNIGRLRKKLEAAGLVHFIETKFGSGYLIG